ncbi:unnamed protein product [Caenorhabditis auriculariae]|uniref:Uncharacterized protein n=1 Tax=Caenorhabditis auriculariae TaxID=2777116 RepID=A0A8S1GUN3_9PELO|nr:unnamed protein product [Caenorhabditis auriculariae]
MALRPLLLLALASSVFCIPSDQQHCYGLECESKEALLDIIRNFQEEKHAEYNAPRNNPAFKRTATVNNFLDAIGIESAAPAPTNCNICSDPSKCINGGTCVPDPRNPFGSYYCLCPDNATGQNCQKTIGCKENSCGPNTNCFVQNHQLNCVCKPGYSGAYPKSLGCTAKTVQSCCNGDPHCTTFDGLHYDYQGTCPYVFSQPCKTLSAPYSYYSVRAKNELVYPGAHVASVSEVEVDFYNRTIHIDGRSKWVLVDGLQVRLPWYYPNKKSPQITVTYSGYTFYVYNDQNVRVTFTTSGIVCVQVPDVAAFTGQPTLCGLAGNRDGNYKNDVVNKNGSIYPVNSRYTPSQGAGFTGFLHTEDSWITDNFLKLRTGQEVCVTGEIINNNTQCDAEKAARSCNPILQAAAGQGPFALCSALSNDTITDLYNDCVYDVCRNPPFICSALYSFVQTCQASVPTGNFGSWRTDTGCALACPLNSHYSSCASSCPASCYNPYPEDCDQGCADGCTCDYGFVMDNTVTSVLRCIPIQQCGCVDQYGYSHPAGAPWISDNCTIWHECQNGSYYSEYRPCGQYSNCEVVDLNQRCNCLPGFTGDGYNCTDINECLNPASCSVNKGQGICTNTPGSYSCACKEYYTGRNCELYMPRRHCADLYHYWSFKTSGVYIINPPYSVNGLPPFSNYSVYCDMDTDGGGFTLMSFDDGNANVNKSYQQYVNGFGDPSTQKLWLGLDLIHGMTILEPHTLRLTLHRCANNGFPAKTTDCTYGSFKVLGPETQYSVVIPKACTGSESVANYYQDGWARWTLSGIGPKFSAYDQENSKDFLCSKTFQNTGFWFDTTIRCGSANLNGVRFSCDNIPSTYESYLSWAGDPLGQATLLLRPAGYPNYDN